MQGRQPDWAYIGAMAGGMVAMLASAPITYGVVQVLMPDAPEALAFGLSGLAGCATVGAGALGGWRAWQRVHAPRPRVLPGVPRGSLSEARQGPGGTDV